MDGKLNITPVKRERLVFNIAEKIESLIMNKDLLPGDKLPSERDLAKQLGVGRYALREAIRTLEARGIVEVRPWLGTFVSNMNSDLIRTALSALLLGKKDEILHLLQVRQFLEVKAAGLVASRGISPEECAKLEGLVEQMESLPIGDASYAGIDTRFHETIIHLVGNPILSHIVESIRELVLVDIGRLIRLPGMQEKSAWHHRQVLEGINKGSPEDAEAAMQAHLGNVERAAREMV